MPDPRHRFLSRATPFEPTVRIDCSEAGLPCLVDPHSHGFRSATALSRHSRSGPSGSARPESTRLSAVPSGRVPARSRPFPRSLGSHPGSAPTPAVVGPYSKTDVPEDVLRAADRALRLLLEVLDRRRNARHLGPMFAPTVVESVKTIVKTGPPGHRLGAASLRRLHASRSSNAASDVFATYSRGQRVFAIAARIEYRSGLRQDRWTITSLRVR